MRKLWMIVSIAALAAASSGAVHAQDRQAYEQRNIARYEEMFTRLDTDQNQNVTRAEANGNIEFTATFDDIDINRDGSVTRAELERFLTQRFNSAGRR